MQSISNRLIGSNAGKGALLAVAFALGLMTLGTAARAESVRIVAMGASNTAGQAVGAAAAWPALLESMLKAKGYDINFSVAGVVGDTSAGIASRVDSAVPNGTKVVLFDVGGGNDKDRGLAMGASRGEIVARIKAKGAIPIEVAYAAIVGAESPSNAAWIQGDPHHHITAQSHQKVAAVLLPKVIAAIGAKK